jgi:hypothetical protein
MPTLLRAALLCAGLVALSYGALWLLANVLEPSPRDIIIAVPPSRYAP